jgi:haloalkane dehalogenase
MHVRHILTSHLHIGRLKEGNNQVPKLLFSVNPGMLLPPHRVDDVAEWMGNPSVVRLGNSAHFPQEEHPHRISEETGKFFDNLSVGK